MNDYNGVVVHIMQVSPIMKIIRIKPEGWEFPDYKAGQFVALGLYGTEERSINSTEEYPPNEDTEKMIKRAYSLASTTSQEYLEFYITLVHSGALTPRIFNLNIGDKIWLGKKAVGMFTLDEVDNDQNIVLVATGTGVAPFMSMLRSNALVRKGKIFILHGAANSWDLGYSSELELLASMFPNFKYYPTITLPNKEVSPWNGDTRFIQEIFDDKTVEKSWGFKPQPDNTHVFLCGNPKMIESATESLNKRNFKVHKRKDPGQIHIEEF